MTINFSSIKSQIPQVKIFNNKNLSVSFAARKNDDSFQRSVVFTEEEYQKRLKQNPNTAFIYDPKLTQAEKQEIIKKTPTLKTTNELSTQLGEKSYKWLDERFFVSDSFTPQKDGKYKNPVKIFDMTHPVNKENFSRLEQGKGKIETIDDIALKNGIPHSIIKQHIEDGFISQITLIDKDTLEETKAGYIDKTDENNQRGLERAKKLSPIDYDFEGEMSNEDILSLENKPVLVNVLELARLGYGNPKDLATFVKEKRFPGTIQKVIGKDGKAKAVVKINVTAKGVEEDLFRLQKSNCRTITELSEEKGIPRRKIEDAILDGTITAIRERSSFLDGDELKINITDLANIDVINQMTLEQRVIEDIQAARKQEELEAKRQEQSTMMKIAWHLCPKTQTVAKNLVGQNKDLQEMFQDKRDIEDTIAKKEARGENTDWLKFVLECFNSPANTDLMSFYKSMWAISGTEEFTQAMKKAREIMQVYKTQGIDAIEDIEIRMIIEDL